MAWTIGSASEHGDPLPAARTGPLRRALLVLGAVALAAGLLLHPAAVPWILLALVGAALLASSAGLARERPPAGAPAFEIARLADGPVAVVGRVVPPKQALLSPLTSTKCSYYDYAVHVLGEDGERRLVEERTRRCDFWLKDVTGSILVRGEDIDVRIPPQLDEDLRTYDQTPRAVGEHLRKLKIDPFLAPGTRRAIFLRETRLDPGDNVLVRGTVQMTPGGERVIGPAPGAVFSVERWTRPTFVPPPSASIRRRAAVGAGLVLGGFAGLLAASA